MTEDRLLDTPLPYPVLYRADEHPEAFKMMLGGIRSPQLLKMWMNFEACFELHSKLFRGAMFMDRGPSGIYQLEIPAWRMQAGHEPKLSEVETASNLIVPGGARAEDVMKDEERKETKP